MKNINLFFLAFKKQVPIFKINNKDFLKFYKWKNSRLGDRDKASNIIQNLVYTPKLIKFDEVFNRKAMRREK